MKRIIERVRRLSNLSIMLTGIILFIFVFPIVNTIKGLGLLLVPVSYTLMILSVTAVVNPRKKRYYSLIALAIIFQWVVFFSDIKLHPIISYLSFLFSVVVFSLATYTMIHQITREKEVNAALIMQAVLGYLLIGIILVLTNVLIISVNPHAIGFNTPHPTLADVIYYSFITYTTIGFGDISPVTPAARSIAILFGLTGQLYLTIIIAFIIGKFSSK